MNVGAVCSGSRTVPQGRLLALLVAAAFLLMAVTGNAFALHVGKAAGPASAAVSADHLSELGVGMPDIAEVTVDASGGAAALMQAGHDVQHLLHLIGACLAVLAAACALLSLLLLARARGRGYVPVPALSRRVRRIDADAWCPPAPSPPRSSPVIRT